MKSLLGVVLRARGKPAHVVHPFNPAFACGLKTEVMPSDVGLMGDASLCKPADWLRVAQDAIERCNAITSEIEKCSPGRRIVHMLDDISDTICEVTDTANFYRAVHADSAWRDAAAGAANVLNTYMACLNTEPILWQRLDTTMAQVQDLSGGERDKLGWSKEEVVVGESLLHEFRLAGLGGSAEVQEAYRTLSGREQSLCSQLMAFERGDGGARVGMALDHSALHDVLFQEMDAGNRKEAYHAIHTPPDAIFGTLVELAGIRGAIAGEAGSPSFMHYKINNVSFARSPGAVTAYMDAARWARWDAAVGETGMLEEYGRQAGILGPSDRLAAWDLPLVKRLGQEQFLCKGHRGQFAVTLDAAFAVLFHVAKELLGVNFQERPSKPGQWWAQGVRRLVACHESRGHLGEVFLDLYRRAGKFTGNAHFTLRCGKWLPHSKRHRPPIVALACSFDGSDSLLSFNEVETLFHEMGHALNSLLCDNSLQHLFGARGPLDIVELPSHILQRVCLDPVVLREMLILSKREGVIRDIKGLVEGVQARRGFCASLRALESLAMPALDVLLHGPSPPASVEGLQRQWLDVLSKLLPYRVAEVGLPHLSINHVVSYGGLCYAYPFADAIADIVWEKVLEKDAFNRVGGRVLADQVFRPGGLLNAQATLDDLAPGSVVTTNGGRVPNVY